MKLSFYEPRIRHRTSSVGWRAFASRILAAIAATIFLVLSVVFSLIAFAIVASVILSVGLFLWWKTREFRRQLRAQRETAARNEGVVIDHEIIRKDPTNRGRPTREVRLINSETK